MVFEVAIDCWPRNAEFLGDVLDSMSPAARWRPSLHTFSRASFICRGPSFWFLPTGSAPRTCGGETVAGPFRHQCVLEFSDGTEDPKEQPAVAVNVSMPWSRTTRSTPRSCRVLDRINVKRILRTGTRLGVDRREVNGVPYSEP